MCDYLKMRFNLDLPVKLWYYIAIRVLRLNMKIITICGSMRFQNEMIKVAAELETEKDLCVLQPVYNCGGKAYSGQELQKFAAAHYKKIDISDAIYVVNVGGYIGESTTREIEYAKRLNKEIVYME